MSLLTEPARAKLNLTLLVHGRRADGYHELESLVAFADLGDELSLEAGDAPVLDVTGPFASAIDGDNLLERVSRAAAGHVPGLSTGRIGLEKELPVAAGLGGGSADAAAFLRLLMRVEPERLTNNIAETIANALGSDILACLRSETVLMQGRGEQLTPVQGLPRAGIVMANPGVPLSAAEIYGGLGASRLPDNFVPAIVRLDFDRSFDRLAGHLESRGNDLQATAVTRAPAIADVLNALEALDGASCVRLSGSGPTCFALFEDVERAQGQADALAAAHPEWWVRATAIGD
ncbi:4-diphosphocytidyl-2-C-methyl-D-erythritol kinase [Methyloligella halotolerans]|uniref:4-diphosphocytidyl-2-C-methyl-D-erythritol kinase n=1 Tax=Methyloligella halotolerans TaxID=1177755 RepID=A0A1E2RYP6_9HYPH|nr:4-(cytidine 5'-diphospho)-2-C-methyl-D-erythritol kinase [Methyloligella halotolerans]ODA67272.1 4-diphosphocytidyl-2-C-methyl-D-erythritol kinase [Methyloligella halotolerans]